MKTPHFLYYWDTTNDHAVRANQRTNVAHRFGDTNVTPDRSKPTKTIITSDRWDNSCFSRKISRQEFRDWVKYGIKPIIIGVGQFRLQ